MQLKIDTSIRKSIITVELETVHFCPSENKMLDQFGEPVFDLEKIYEGEFAVSIHKKIRTNFKVKVRFDGTKDIDKASRAANAFTDEVKLLVEDLLEKYMDKMELIDIQAGTDIETIHFGLEKPIYPPGTFPPYPNK